MDFKTIVMLRVYQMVGVAFLFVPIQTMCYVGVPMEKNNNVSGMTNLARNMGGSIGIAGARNDSGAAHAIPSKRFVVAHQSIRSTRFNRALHR